MHVFSTLPFIPEGNLQIRLVRNVVETYTINVNK